MADPFIPSADAERLQDALEALQGEPWLDLMKRCARGGKLRDDGSSTGGGNAGGSFANRSKAQQRVRNAIRAPQAVVKIVRSGGAGSARDLVSQLTYLSRDGELKLIERMRTVTMPCLPYMLPGCSPLSSPQIAKRLSAACPALSA